MLRSPSSCHLTLLLRIAPLVFVNMIFLRRDLTIFLCFTHFDIQRLDFELIRLFKNQEIANSNHTVIVKCQID